MYVHILTVMCGSANMVSSLPRNRRNTYVFSNFSELRGKVLTIYGQIHGFFYIENTYLVSSLPRNIFLFFFVRFSFHCLFYMLSLLTNNIDTVNSYDVI